MLMIFVDMLFAENHIKSVNSGMVRIENRVEVRRISDMRTSSAETAYLQKVHETSPRRFIDILILQKR